MLDVKEREDSSGKRLHLSLLLFHTSFCMFAKSYVVFLIEDRYGLEGCRYDREVSVKVNEASGRLMGSL